MRTVLDTLLRRLWVYLQFLTTCIRTKWIGLLS